MICAYLTEPASEGALVPTLDLAIGAISYARRSRGLDDPTLTEAVRQVRRGLRRIVGTAPRRQAQPLATAHIRRRGARADHHSGQGPGREHPAPVKTALGKALDAAVVNGLIHENAASKVP